MEFTFITDHDSSRMVLMVKCLICNTKLEYHKHDTSTLIDHIQEQHPHLNIKNLQKTAPTTKDTSIQTLTSPKKQHIDKEVFVNLEFNDGSDLKNSEFEHVLEDQFKHEKDPLIKHSKTKKILRYNFNGDDNVSSEELIEKVVQVPDDKNVKVLYKREFQPMKAFKAKPPGSKKLYKTSIEKWKPGEGKITCPECGQTRRPIIRIHAEKISKSSVGAACIMTCWPFCFLPCMFPPPTRENLHCAVCNHFLGVYDYKKEIISPNLTPAEGNM